MTETSQPAQQPQSITFKEIAYFQKREVNYLNDIADMGPKYVAFLESLNYNQIPKVERSAYNSIADDLYKKIVKQGYVDRPSKVAKKSKKGDAQVNFYNINDSFIDDQDCCIQKKEKSSTFQDYSCVPVTSIEQLYSSPQYKKLREQLIIEEGKRKGQQFSLNEVEDKQRFDQMRKNIKSIILGRNTRPIVYENESNNNPNMEVLDENNKVIEIADDQEPIIQQEKKQ